MKETVGAASARRRGLQGYGGAAPARLRRILDVPPQQPGHGRGIAHLDGSAKLRAEEFAEGAPGCDVLPRELTVAPGPRLVAAVKPTAIGRVGLDDPYIRMVGWLRDRLEICAVLPVGSWRYGSA